MNFNDLDLTGDSLQGAPRLRVGRHTVRCTEAVWAQKTGTSDWRVEAKFEALDGTGSTNFYFNTGHHNEDARRIGRSQLKTFLTCAGHPNPDKPGNVTSLKGLVCDVLVDLGKPFRDDKSGKMVQNPEIKTFLPKGDGSYSGGSAPLSAPDRVAASTLNDSIPF